MFPNNTTNNEDNEDNEEDIIMRKFVALVLTFIMVALAVVAATMFISLNNHSNNDVRSTVSTAASTVAPTVAPMLPMLPMVTFASAPATVAPVTTSAPAPVVTVPVTTSAPAPVVTAPVEVSSLDVSKKTIVTDDEGNFRQMMIRSGDLSKVDYDEIVIDTWNGVSLLVNTNGVVGEVFTREDESNDDARRAGIRKESIVRTFFNTNGEVKADCVREGYAVSDTEIGTYNLTNVRFVQIAGEENYRLVICGKSSYTGGGNGGNADPTAAPAPTQKPAPTQEPVLPTPEATKEPGGNNNPNTPAPTQEPVLPTPEATKEPGGGNSGLPTPEATKEPIGSTEAGGSNSDISKVNATVESSETAETSESSESSSYSESASDSSVELVEDFEGSNSALPSPEDF